MAKPTNKKDLIIQSEHNYNTLIEYINELNAESKTRTFKEGMLNRNIRDVVAHLQHWHLLQLEWYEVGMKGDKPSMPAEGYAWSAMPQLNLMIREMYKHVVLDDAIDKLESSHARIMNLIDGHTDKELFTKKKYHWTGSTSLGAYLISATSSHYVWALKLIKKQLRV